VPAAGGGYALLAHGVVEGRRDSRPQESSLLFRLPEHDLYPENIAYDPVSGDYFLGSMSRSRILRVHPDGSYEDFLAPDAGGELLSSVGMKVDAERRNLWVCSGRFSLFADYAAAPARTGVIQYDLDTGEALDSWMMDQESDYHICNDLVVARGGEVYFTTTLIGAVYRISPGDAGMTLVHQLADGRHNNGIALGPDERYAFLTVDRTLSRLDLRTGELVALTAPDEAVVGSDGLYYRDGSLVVVRPRFPGVSQLFLNDAMDTVTEVRELVDGHPDLAYPTTGVVVAENLVYVATSYADQPRRPDVDAQHGDVLIHRVRLERPRS
jgi:sugar lactone lactonase YvrE